MKKSLLFSLVMFSCATVNAEPISLEYQSFYQRLKQVNKGNYQLVEVAFSVSKANGCKLIDGTISTEKESFPLTFTKDQRIFLPYDAQLKSDRALINLNVDGDAKSCAIAMQVRSKNTKQAYDGAELLQIQTEMNTLLSMMQGFPMRYFASEIAGLNLEFDADVVITLDGKKIPVSGTYRLDKEVIESLNSIEFSQAPKVISPWTAK
ncbi:DUF2987 domain-containing protein [Shewanella sp. Choline-02u-19]|jgi:hypothetical protein|uniref:DUF2987 domain-containing protein n=1 Tax=unclassified Shewanella TaxID=196818 RepID=UPI000C32FB6E|nr:MULTISPECIES: DUF2987 domain-containing protein [unclassified Shewanella]PKG73710.1 DUF2987 domain-containing protein [Shewanella sp. GutCb]PKH56366.1 DUF2987 domain-containing protein [Shewanella sp. Bg11-22]PKI27540.1 DUF2987 domain-containing protein [Shewanella sp. Choline-02u-19]